MTNLKQRWGLEMPWLTAELLIVYPGIAKFWNGRSESTRRRSSWRSVPASSCRRPTLSALHRAMPNMRFGFIGPSRWHLSCFWFGSPQDRRPALWSRVRSRHRLATPSLMTRPSAIFYGQRWRVSSSVRMWTWWCCGRSTEGPRGASAGIGV